MNGNGINNIKLTLPYILNDVNTKRTNIVKLYLTIIIIIISF